MIRENHLKIINLITGLTIFMLGLIVIYFNLEFLLGAMILFSISFMVSGITRIFNALLDKSLDQIAYFAKLMIGSIFLIIGLIVMLLSLFNPSISIAILLALFKYVLFIISIVSIIMGYFTDIDSKFYRILLITFGFVTFALSTIMIFLESPY